MRRILLWLRQLRKKIYPYTSLIHISVSRENILHNLHEYQRANPTLLFAPVLKSNAYGHGLVEVARILENEQIAFFVVDSLFEAMTLRRAGVRNRLLVIGYTPVENIENCAERNISFTITGIAQLAMLSATLKTNRKFHVKIDTGMRRHGIIPCEIDAAIRLIRANAHIVLEGVCSHFSDADGDDEAFTRKQIAIWQSARAKMRREFHDLRYFHIAATAGAAYAHENLGNVARLGIGLYGFAPSKKTLLALKPALSMRSEISSVKTLEKGESIGYNRTYVAPQKMTVATIPAGYFEGIDRRLSNCGFAQVRDTFCPIVGRVSMNIASLNVSAINDVKLGDAVIIISDKTEHKNSAANIATLAKTIPYEILVHIPQHLKRTVI